MVKKAQKTTTKKENGKKAVAEKTQKQVKTQTKKENKNSKNYKKHPEIIEKDHEEKNDQLFTDVEETAIIEDIKESYKKNLEIVKADLNLDKDQVSKALKCLKKIISARYKDNVNLLANEADEFVYLNFVFSRLPVKYSLRPVSIPISTPVYSSKLNTRVCLFVKDPRSDFKDLSIKFPFKVKVLDIEKLKLKYSRFQERRNLLKEFDMFLCDYKIYMVLKKLLGKPFYVHKKYPIPIKLDYTNPDSIRDEVTSSIETSTVFNMTNGPNYSIKAARVVSDDDKIIKNIVDCVTYTIPHILKWGVDLHE